jgi:hypothetical protein
VTGAPDGQLGLFPEDDARPRDVPAPATACRPGVQWRPGYSEDPPRPGMIYSGACGCGWEGPDHLGENAAVEDAHDHAWPGWRDQPLMPPVPHDDAEATAWLARARRVYPRGWLDSGGPVRTARVSPIGCRHHRSHLWNGFDMGVLSGTAARPEGSPPTLARQPDGLPLRGRTRPGHGTAQGTGRAGDARRGLF